MRLLLLLLLPLKLMDFIPHDVLHLLILDLLQDSLETIRELVSGVGPLVGELGDMDGGEELVSVFGGGLGRDGLFGLDGLDLEFTEIIDIVW